MEELIYFIITIGILVFVHEFGHFAAAKLTGMRVDAFAIGFGFRLFGYNKKSGFSFGNLPKDFDGEGFTDYRICLLPLGGYVKIAGMVDESMDTAFASSEPKPYEFRSKGMGAKIFTITGGVLMNLFLAIAIFWGINFFIGKQLTKSTTIAYVKENSAADSAGFKTGDKIISINEKNVRYWEDVRNQLFVNTLGKDVVVVVERNGNKENLSISRSKIPSDETIDLFLTPAGVKPLIADVLKGNIADSAGIKPNDIILTINDEEISTSQQTIDVISANAGKKVEIKLLRNDDTVSVAAVPNNEGKIGILIRGYTFLGETERRTYGLFASLSNGLSDIANMTQLTFVMLKRVIFGEIEFKKAFGGPVKIAQFAARSADTGILSFLQFLAMLSLSLAIINILPFPVLDGGHLVIIIVEGILRREIPLKVKIAIQNAGFVILLLLMAFIIYNDIISM